VYVKLTCEANRVNVLIGEDEDENTTDSDSEPKHTSSGEFNKNCTYRCVFDTKIQKN